MLQDLANIKPKYSAYFRKDLLSRFFSILNLNGYAYAKMDHNESFELEFYFENQNHLRIQQHCTTRKI